MKQKIFVNSYYRKDGTFVKGYYKDVEVSDYPNYEMRMLYPVDGGWVDPDNPDDIQNPWPKDDVILSKRVPDGMPMPEENPEEEKRNKKKSGGIWDKILRRSETNPSNGDNSNEGNSNEGNSDNTDSSDNSNSKSGKGNGPDWGEVFGNVLSGLSIAVNVAIIILEILEEQRKKNEIKDDGLSQKIFDNYFSNIKVEHKKSLDVQNKMLDRLSKTKDKDEYSKLMKDYVKVKDINAKTGNAMNKVSYGTENKAYNIAQEGLKELASLSENYKSQSSKDSSFNYRNEKPLDFSKLKYKYNHRQINNTLKDIQLFDQRRTQMTPEHSDVRLRKQLLIDKNNTLNKNRPEAWLLMDLAIDSPKTEDIYSEFIVIAPEYKKYVINALNLNKYSLNIDKIPIGIGFHKKSILSRQISQSPELQDYIYKHFKDGDKVITGFGFEKDINLKYAFGHCTILNPRISKDGYFKGVLFDIYDFDYIPIDKNNSISTTNDIAWFLQIFFILKRYYIIVPIEFPIAGRKLL